MKTLRFALIAAMAGMAAFCHTAQAQSCGNNATQGIDDVRKSIPNEVIVVDEKPAEEMVWYYDQVEVKPSFPGGEKAKFEYLAATVRWPDLEGIQGTVVVQFVIEKDGTVTNAKVVRSPHEAFSKEGVRVVMSMPKWTPGKKDGKPVRVTHTIPIRFKYAE